MLQLDRKFPEKPAHQDIALLFAAALCWCRRRPAFFCVLHSIKSQSASAMLDPKILDDLSARLAEMAARGPARDIEKNAKALLNGLFARLDFVSREEFEVQREVLARTREKLTALEARLASLETRDPGSTSRP
jgi:BMFP domain-containing protein YqiC